MTSKFVICSHIAGFSRDISVQEFVKELVGVTAAVSNWRSVGEKLKIDKTSLEQIDESHQDKKNALEEMYKKWIGDNWGVSMEVLLNELNLAFEDAGFHEIASHIKEKYCKSCLLTVLVML